MQEPFDDPRLEISVRRVRDDDQAVRFLGPKEEREQIEQPNGVFGLIAKVELDGLAVSIDDAPDAHLAARRGDSKG